jgi:thiol-disulfide isomerase/thioredoxin
MQFGGFGEKMKHGSLAILVLFASGWQLQLSRLATVLLVAGCVKPAVELPNQNKSPVVEAVNAGVAGELKLIDREGREIWPPSDKAIKAVALVFVLPDCPICNAYIPELNRLNDDLDKSGVRLILIHADTTVTAAEAEKHAREYELQMPVALDPQRTWIKKAEATIAPEAAVFSRDGELLYRGRIDNQYAGLGKRRAIVTSHDLRDACEAVSTGQPVKEPRTEAIGCLLLHD